MKKRFLSLILLAALLTMLFVPASHAVDDTVPDSAGDYYVYTENGKNLNVRNTPGGTVVGSLKYGTKIYCYYVSDGWALIDYTYDMPGYGKGTYACFVSSRYLQKTKPGPKPQPATPAKTPAKAPTTDSASTVDELNAEFATAKKVAEPYAVTVRPTRVTGWVNLRWAPSKEAELITTYGSGAKLLVIYETANWYQVEDQDTGDVGFINRAFVQK